MTFVLKVYSGLTGLLVCCVQIVKLSDAVQEMPRSVTQFVHGVPGSFLAVGEAKAKPPPDGGPRFTKGAYFIGKVRPHSWALAMWLWLDDCVVMMVVFLEPSNK